MSHKFNDESWVIAELYLNNIRIYLVMIDTTAVLHTNTKR